MTVNLRAYILFGALLFASHSFSEPLRVTDYSGREISLNKPATRIVALAPHIVENIYSAGAGETIVGAVEYCDYPEKAKSIPRVGSFSSFSLETILGLNPDLVVAWESGRGGRIIAKLESLGITVYGSNPEKLEDVAKSIRDFGILTGRSATAKIAAQAYLDKLAALNTDYKNKIPLSVMYQVWNSPIQTLNDQHIISDLMKLCGASNAFGDLPMVAPKLSVESVISRNPDVIVASGFGEERPSWLDEWLKWPMLAAVQKNNLYFIPPDIIQRHTTRILDGAELMCRHLDSARLKSDHTK
ncbi:iron complex transport system substrate-binding protein [Alteromonadaceae bacterium Bs31]|nr:iron complex transport system substrate-binding protein [Alteromonadaceae bacterium Bs31]